MATTVSMHYRVLEAALACMREDGVRGTTTKKVARRAGVSEGSIYNHFANRSELIVEAFGLVTEPVRDHARKLQELVGANTVEENLVTLMETVIPFFQDVTPIVGTILGDPELRSWFTKSQVPAPDGWPLTPLTGVTELSAYLEEEHRLGRLHEKTSWVACSTMLIGACLHYAYLELLTPSGLAEVAPDTEGVRDHARDVVRTLLHT